MKKKIMVLSIILLVCCIGIPPIIAADPLPGVIINDPVTVNSYAFQPKMITQKENLTPGEMKLSTALLLESRGSSDSSALNPQDSGSGLITKTIPVQDTSAALNSEPEKVPSGNLVYVYIYTKPGYSTHIVDSLVADVTDRDEDNHLAVGWVDIQNLLAVAGLEGVRTIREVIPPVVNMGSVTTQGDAIHKTAYVRSTYGYKGAGMKIGIISNGVNHIADSKAKGDLPSTVHVLSDTVGGDEGTAMLEIVYDMVPDAELYFHDCGSNTIAFNNAIAELKASGCTVICDDIGWLTEPFFEDGIVAKNITTLLSGNKTVYVSSAGNAATKHYQGEFYSLGGTNWTDFSRGTNATFPSLYVNMPYGSSVRIVLEWNDQFGHSGNDYDLVLYDTSNYGTPLSYSINVQNGTQDPLEFLYYQNTGEAKVVEIDVYKDKGASKILELYIYPASGASLFSNNRVASDSIFGHPAVTDVVAVGAISAADPGNDNIESFSSLGPVTITYPSPTNRLKPDISGIDGVAVTGAGNFSNPFYGTSAAAPHIAAIVAQVWGGANKTLTPAQLRSALYTSAVDLGSAGKDTTFGYGRANASKMVDILGLSINKSNISSKIGVVRDNKTWLLDASGNGAYGAGDLTNTFGTAGDRYVTGDWTGNGTTRIGVVRNNKTWLLDASGNGAYGAGDRTYTFGTAGDVYITGDWTGNGTTRIGVVRNNKTWLLDASGNGAYGAGDIVYTFGTAGDVYVTGDWNNDHKTEIGVVRNNKTWLLDASGNGAYGAGDLTYTFGTVGDRYVTGDWTGNGTTRIGVVRSNTTWLLDASGNGAYGAGDLAYTFGKAGDKYVTGKWN